MTWRVRNLTGAGVGAQDLLPGIINQLGPDNLENLKKIAEQYTGGAVCWG